VSEPAGQVRLWVCRIPRDAGGVARLSRVLSEEEWRRAAAIGVPEARRRFVLARGTVRCVLGGVIDVAPERVRFRYGGRGKPALLGAGSRSVHFNAAHSGGLVLVAIARDREVGVDVELVRHVPGGRRIAARFLPERVCSRLGGASGSFEDEALLRWWTIREAHAKATGMGIGASRGLLSVTRTVAGLMSVSQSVRAPARWFGRELRPAAGYVASVFAEGRDWDVSLSWLGDGSVHPAA